MVTLKRGYDLPSRERQEGDVPIVSSSGVTGFHHEAKVKGPGVVTGRYGTLGEVFYVEGAYWPLNTTLYVQDFKGNHPRFISYFLQTLNFARQNAAGAVPGINRNALHMLPVRCPSLPLQEHIADTLSAYDDLIENNTRRIAVLEEMAQAIYREWFVNFRFPSHEQVKMVDSELGLVPEGWEVTPVSSAVNVNPRIKVDKAAATPHALMESLTETSMLVLSERVRTGGSGSKFQNGDTLFARITPCLENGKTGFVQFLPTATAVATGSTEFIVLRSRSLCPEFVYLLARSDQVRGPAIKSMTGASGRQRVQLSVFDEVKIAHPSPAILTRFRSMVQPIFRQVWALARQSDVLRQTRDLLLPKLISGEIDMEALESVPGCA